MSSRGVVMFANNNGGEFDYLKIAYLNSFMIKENLGIENISIITDEETIESGYKLIGESTIDDNFDEIILLDKNELSEDNVRSFRDTNYRITELPFYNNLRSMAYTLSPYEETLLLDSDYLVMSPVLNNVWGSDYDLMMNKTFSNLMFGLIPDGTDRVNQFMMPHYWATVVYFKKSAIAENFFALVENIALNYDFYRCMYGVDDALFRNDIAFSIAFHMMVGYVENYPLVTGMSELPISSLHKVFDSGDIHKINGKNDITFCVDKLNDPYNFIMVRSKDLDVHVMNKWAIHKHWDKLIEVYA